ncbi:MAG: Spy/CpxP family protein refolding chaperone [Kiritimatiellae bacterium]|nr:Spy/CpxP family protein refolding chaperone [Kiritimatiellia bacterium]
MSRIRGLICAMAVGMLATGVAYPASGETNASAQGPGFGGRCMADTNAPGRRPHGDKGFGGRRMAGLKRLNLTADQKQKIDSIFKSSQESMKAAMTQCQEARKALHQQMQSGPFDEQSVRAASKKAAAADEEAAVLRAKVAGQIRAVLTSEQQAELDKVRAEAQNKMRGPPDKENGGTDK